MNRNNKKECDVAVVGLGVMGSGALYECSKRGLKCIGIEQYSMPHSRGSSHGHTRITRHLYKEPHFASLAKESWKLWEQLEEEANTQLIIPTGGVGFGPQNGTEFQQLLNTCQTVGIAHRVMTAEEAKNEFPGLSVPSNYGVVYTKDAGLIQASKSVTTLQTQSKLRGAEIIDNLELIDVKNSKGIITLTLKPTTIRTVNPPLIEIYCKKVVICPGAWITPLLQKLFQLAFPSVVIKQGYWYFEAENKEIYSADKFPVFIDYGVGDKHIYGTPAYEYPGLLKVGGHGDFFTSFPTTADDRNFVPNGEIFKFVQQKVKLHFPRVNYEQPAMSETCLYTWTKDEQFILDYLPSDPHVIIGGGGSGHAFKHGTGIGCILADLAQDISPSFSSPFYKFSFHLSANSNL